MKGGWHKPVGLLVAAVILFFIIRSLKGGLEALGTYRLGVSAIRIAGAFAAYGILLLVYGRLWQFMVGKFGYKVSYRRSLRLWLLSQAGRYVPGKVWFALGRIYLAEREGVPKAITTVAMGLELALVLGSSILIFGLAWLVRPSAGGHAYLWSLLLVPLVVAGIHPRVIREILARLRRLSRGGAVEVTEGFRLTYTDTLKMLVIYGACWCVYGVGYYLIATAVVVGAGTAGAPAPLAAGFIPEIIGINALSWTVGFVSILTPAGLGIREGASTFLLSGLCDKPYPSLIPLVARVWTTIAELAAIGLAALAGGKR